MSQTVATLAVIVRLDFDGEQLVISNDPTQWGMQIGALTSPVAISLTKAFEEWEDAEREVIRLNELAQKEGSSSRYFAQGVRLKPALAG